MHISYVRKCRLEAAGPAAEHRSRNDLSRTEGKKYDIEGNHVCARAQHTWLCSSTIARFVHDSHITF